MASLAPTGPVANPRRNVLILDSTAARTASANSDTVASQEHQRPNVGQATSKEAANATVFANLNLSLSPPAVLAVAEDAVARRALYWEGLESVFVRLMQVEGRIDDVYDLMTICYFEWLYSKPVKRRVIRLIETSQPGAMRWQHMVRHLICFEFDGDSEYPELYPAHKLYFSNSRVRMFFDVEGRFVHWDRPYVGRRSML